MKLSIIIPVYNELTTIEILIEKILAVNFPFNFELVVVNDGSSDGTGQKLEEICQQPQFSKSIRLVNYSENKGKGYAIRAGLKVATGDIMAIQDADLEYNPEELPRLVAPIIEAKTSVVYGSRFAGKITKISFSHFLGNIILTKLTNLLFGSHLTDMETCYKIFSRTVYEKMKLAENGFEIEAEITAQILKNGFSIMELPITYVARDKKSGKKINWRDGLKTAVKIIKYRLSKK